MKDKELQLINKKFNEDASLIDLLAEELQSKITKIVKIQNIDNFLGSDVYVRDFVYQMLTNSPTLAGDRYAVYKCSDKVLSYWISERVRNFLKGVLTDDLLGYFYFADKLYAENRISKDVYDSLGAGSVCFYIDKPNPHFKDKK